MQSGFLPTADAVESIQNPFIATCSLAGIFLFGAGCWLMYVTSAGGAWRPRKFWSVPGSMLAGLGGALYLGLRVCGRFAG